MEESDGVGFAVCEPDGAAVCDVDGEDDAWGLGEESIDAWDDGEAVGGDDGGGVGDDGDVCAVDLFRAPPGFGCAAEVGDGLFMERPEGPHGLVAVAGDGQIGYARNPSGTDARDLVDGIQKERRLRHRGDCNGGVSDAPS